MCVHAYSLCPYGLRTPPHSYATAFVRRRVRTQVAVAPRHAALVTRHGELYTWGVGESEPRARPPACG